MLSCREGHGSLGQSKAFGRKVTERGNENLEGQGGGLRKATQRRRGQARKEGSNKGLLASSFHGYAHQSALHRQQLGFGLCFVSINQSSPTYHHHHHRQGCETRCSEQLSSSHGGIEVLGESEGGAPRARRLVQQHGRFVRAQAMAPAHAEA